MNNLNSVLVEGNLTKDPQSKEISTGNTVCTFSIATNRYYKQNKEQHHEVSYFDIEVWAKLAEQCQEYLEKGRGVRVVGRLKQDQWDDEQGKQHSRIRVVAEHVEFKPRAAANKSTEDGESTTKGQKSSETEVKERVPA